MARKTALISSALGIAIGVTMISAVAGRASQTVESRGTLVIAAAKTPNGIDPEYHFDLEDHAIRRAVDAWLMRLPLRVGQSGVRHVDYDKAAAGKLVPELAERWSLSNGGRTLTVHLRRGVRSHAGNELTANDVQYTWNRHWRLKATGTFYLTVNLGLKRPNWRVLDRYTWRVTIPRRNAVLALIQANNDLPVLDSTELKKHATSDDPWSVKWLARHDAGFGPYRVTEWTPGNRVVLTAHRDYFAGAPAFERIIYRAVPDASQRRTLVETGAVDVAEKVNYSDLAALRRVRSVKIWNIRANILLKMTMLQTNPVFATVKGRQAIMYATPVRQILDSVFFGFGAPMKGPLAPDEAYAAPDLWNYKFDPARARTLLQEAGVRPGTSFTITYDTTWETHRDIAAILKTAYENIGLSIKVQGVPSSAFFTNLFGHKYDAALAQFGYNTPDPSYEMNLSLPCNASFNASKYCNRAVDKLLAEGYTTLDVAKRKGIFRTAQRLLINTAAENWMIHPGWQLVTKPDITGVAWDNAGMAYLGLLRRR